MRYGDKNLIVAIYIESTYVEKTYCLKCMKKDEAEDVNGSEVDHHSTDDSGYHSQPTEST